MISLAEVTVGYGADRARPVLEKVTVDFPDGAITAILGPNGVGKTTLLNLCLGWLKPWLGSVRVDGSGLGTMGNRQRGRLLSLVPQSDHVPFEYTLLEYVLLGRAPYLQRTQAPRHEDVAAAEDALARVGLVESADRPVLEISAGERQLVLLARSLAQDTRALLLDEPAAHLDPANKRRLVSLLRDQAADGRCVITTVHEPQFAMHVADRVVLLAAGAVAAEGLPDDVMTAQLLSAAYSTPIEVRRVDSRSAFFW